MNISNEGLNLIKKFEGLRLKAYKPVASEKYYTIGYGHYGSDVKPDMVITEAKATEYLLSDLATAEKYVNKHNLKYNFTQSQYDALVSFTFNCGGANLTKLTANDTRTKEEISKMLLAYNKAGGKVLAGLTERRKKEQELFNRVNTSSEYYKAYVGSSEKLDVILASIGVPPCYVGNVTRRIPVARTNNISDYTGSYEQNMKLIMLAKAGKLRVV